MQTHPAPATLPAGERIYAIGDVHGCAERLTTLHRLVAADRAARPVARATLVHLGDYVDRGPDSAGVLAMLARGERAGTDAVVNLLGNHEAMLLAALGDGQPPYVAQTAREVEARRHDVPARELLAEDAAVHWLMNGGDATLRSWGIDEDVPRRDWAARVPPDQRALLHGLALHHAAGGYVFVHAGVAPGVPLAQQDIEDLLWIREPFLSSRGDLGMVVVHGHTPLRAPEVRRNRIGVDTGAVAGGALTCLVLEGERLGFLVA